MPGTTIDSSPHMLPQHQPVVPVIRGVHQFHLSRHNPSLNLSTTTMIIAALRNRAPSYGTPIPSSRATPFPSPLPPFVLSEGSRTPHHSRHHLHPHDTTPIDITRTPVLFYPHRVRWGLTPRGHPLRVFFWAKISQEVHLGIPRKRDPHHPQYAPRRPLRTVCGTLHKFH